MKTPGPKARKETWNGDAPVAPRCRDILSCTQRNDQGTDAMPLIATARLLAHISGPAPAFFLSVQRQYSVMHDEITRAPCVGHPSCPCPYGTAPAEKGSTTTCETLGRRTILEWVAVLVI